MKYLRIYAGPDGESHFEDVEVDLAPVLFVPGSPTVDASAGMSSTAVGFTRFPPSWHGNYHPMPRRGMIVVLSGEIEAATSDGEVRRVGPGAACLLEDTSGKGHHTRVVGSDEWCALVVWLPVIASPDRSLNASPYETA